MIKKILLGLALVLVLLVIVVAMQPADFRITRTATIDGPPALVVQQINDFHNWHAWSPFEKLDPDAKRTFSGSESGKDAKYGWSGNDQMGEGEMTITKSTPEEVRIDLHFIRPRPDNSEAIFQFKPVGEKTEVTWIMEGKKDLIAKAMFLFIDMDKMLGAMFEEGLTSLNTSVKDKQASTSEKPAEASAPAEASEEK